MIRQDIERTRADMSRTVDEIEHRLSPAHLKEQVADLKENVLGQFHDAKEQIKSELKGGALVDEAAYNAWIAQQDASTPAQS